MNSGNVKANVFALAQRFEGWPAVFWKVLFAISLRWWVGVGWVVTPELVGSTCLFKNTQLNSIANENALSNAQSFLRCCFADVQNQITLQWVKPKLQMFSSHWPQMTTLGIDRRKLFFLVSVSVLDPGRLTPASSFTRHLGYSTCDDSPADAPVMRLDTLGHCYDNPAFDVSGGGCLVWLATFHTDCNQHCVGKTYQCRCCCFSGSSHTCKRDANFVLRMWTTCMSIDHLKFSAKTFFHTSLLRRWHSSGFFGLFYFVFQNLWGWGSSVMSCARKIPHEQWFQICSPILRGSNQWRESIAENYQGCVSGYESKRCARWLYKAKHIFCHDLRRN